MKKSFSKLSPPHMDLLFNHCNTSICMIDKQERILYLNPASERLLGISAKTGEGKKIGDILFEAPEITQAIQETSHTGRTVKAYEVSVLSPQGPLVLEIEIAPIGNPEKPLGLLMIMQELSMLQNAQKEKLLSDRLSMLDTLAMGLAHEIRNPLGGIRGAAQMLILEENPTERQELTNIILSETDRMNRLITELLDFSKPNDLKARHLDIHCLLDELLSLQRPSLNKNSIRIKQEFDPSLPPVIGNPDKLKQAFLNLFKNAEEAMPSGGCLTISTRYIHDPQILLAKGKVGPMVQISICDSGKGIPEENLNSLFTPFFTTKAQGSGLGLVITQRIIREHEGLLRVSSPKGQGAQFQVFLKLADYRK